MASFQVELQKFFVGIVAHGAVSSGGTVQRPVVTEHQNAVFSHLQIQFHHIHTHANHRLDGRNGIFGIVAPVTAMGNDDNILGIRVMQSLDDF